MRMNTKQGKAKTWLGGSKMVFENPYITLYGIITMWHFNKLCYPMWVPLSLWLKY
jgi:hypothetical protein